MENTANQKSANKWLNVLIIATITRLTIYPSVLSYFIPRQEQNITTTLKHLSCISNYSLSLFDRVEDVDNFYRAFKKRGYTVYKSTGEMNKKDREEHLEGFKKTGGYLIGVSSTLNRGYDEVKLSKAFILYPVKGENSVRQIVGRIIRTYKDKNSYLYLWSDSSLSFQLKAQKKIIKQFFNIDVV